MPKAKSSKKSSKPRAKKAASKPKAEKKARAKKAASKPKAAKSRKRKPAAAKPAAAAPAKPKRARKPKAAAKPKTPKRRRVVTTPTQEDCIETVSRAANITREGFRVCAAKPAAGAKRAPAAKILPRLFVSPEEAAGWNDPAIRNEVRTHAQKAASKHRSAIRVLAPNGRQLAVVRP